MGILPDKKANSRARLFIISLVTVPIPVRFMAIMPLVNEFVSIIMVA